MGEEIKNFTIKDANTGKDLLTVDGGIVTWSDNSVSSISTSEEGTTATYTDLTTDTVSSNNLIKIDEMGTLYTANASLNPMEGWFTGSYTTTTPMVGWSDGSYTTTTTPIVLEMNPKPCTITIPASTEVTIGGPGPSPSSSSTGSVDTWVLNLDGEYYVSYNLGILYDKALDYLLRTRGFCVDHESDPAKIKAIYNSFQDRIDELEKSYKDKSFEGFYLEDYIDCVKGEYL